MADRKDSRETPRTKPRLSATFTPDVPIYLQHVPFEGLPGWTADGYPDIWQGDTLLDIRPLLVDVRDAYENRLTPAQIDSIGEHVRLELLRWDNTVSSEVVFSVQHGFVARIPPDANGETLLYVLMDKNTTGLYRGFGLRLYRRN